MNASLKSRYFFQIAVTFFLLFFFSSVFAQTHTARKSKAMDNVSGFYEYLPQGYNDDNSTYPLMIFVHGIGELDDGTFKSMDLLLRHGPPKLINNGTFPVSFTVNGQTFKFIIISPQFIAWPKSPDVQGVIDYAIKNYRVNSSKIYLTGLSMGGGVVWDYAGSSTAVANSVAAIVPICGVSGPIIERVTIFANTNLPIWATHNLIDPAVAVSNTIGYIDQITAMKTLLNPQSVMNPVVKKTIFPVEGHDAWSTTYDPNYRENGKNIYEWMLSYSRGDGASAILPVPPAPNKYPSAVAGSDQTITLPANSVTLSGSGTDPDGSISSYSWTQLSGPSQSTINAGNSPTATITNLKEGNYVFRLTITDNSGAVSWDEAGVKVNAAPVVVPPIDVPNVILPPTPPSSAAPIPGLIQGETFNNMSGVGIEKTTDEGGGTSIGWIDRGDWFDYNVNVASSGDYNVNFRLASSDGGQFQLKSADGSVLATVNVPQTGGFQSWRSVGASIYLNAGTQTIRINSTSNGNWNLNWADFILVKAASTGAAIPGKIEVENYNSMYGILNEPCNDLNGGLDVAWIERGDWMDYNVNVATTGTYTVNLRVASPYDGQQLQIKTADGTVLTTANIPKTGSFQIWKTMTTTISLKAGAQTLRIYSAQNGWWNINWADFVLAQGATGFAIPGKIENENYNAMYGVLNEYSNDDGGQNVGWIEQGDWMDYNVSVSSEGYYNINFRVSSPYAGQQLQLKTSDGIVLTSVNLPQTGSFQIWRTVSANNVYLPVGNQTLRVYSSKAGWWDINWMEFAFQSSSSGVTTQAERTLSGAITSDNMVATPVFSIYPNPVKNMFTMQIRNKYTGLMNVKIVNQLGSVVKQFKLTKDLQESQLNLSVKELPTGTYFIKVQVGDWSESKKLIKL